MRAVVQEAYGSPDVLRVEQVDRPAPAAGQVLVAVRASSVNPYDWHLLTGLPRLLRSSLGGMRRPGRRVLGADFSGVVEEVGDGVEGLFPGDEVYGQTARGAFAEFLAVGAALVAAKPSSLSFEEAAAVPLAGVTALQGLRDGAGLQEGESVLINGASGGVGHFAVQVARGLGAEVTGVCSTRNLEMVRGLGADHTIDYTRDDFTRGGRRYDVIFDLIGNHGVSAVRRCLADGGRYLSLHGQPEHLWIGPLGFLARMAAVNLFTRKRLGAFLARQSADDLAALAAMADAGTLRPVIDRTFPLEQVPEAFRHLEAWHTRGKVAIAV